jgi:hypothetical protein
MFLKLISHLGRQTLIPRQSMWDCGARVALEHLFFKVIRLFRQDHSTSAPYSHSIYLPLSTESITKISLNYSVCVSECSLCFYQYALQFNPIHWK